MFESLDQVVLGEISKIDNLSSLDPDSRLAQLVACLDQAEQECTAQSKIDGDAFQQYQQVAMGIAAARRMLVKVWEAGGRE